MTMLVIVAFSFATACDETPPTCPGETTVAPTRVCDCDDAPGHECVPARSTRRRANASTCPADAGCGIALPFDDGPTRDILVRGFGVSRVQLRNVHDPEVDAAQFEWSPPKDAWIAKCALFGCAPVIAERRIQNIQPDDAGANHCLLAEQVMKPVPKMLDVRDLDYRMDVKQERLTALRYGCWVYDKARLIAATPLERVDASAAPGIERVLELSCVEASDRAACPVPASESLVGRCRGTRCLRICDDDDDCVMNEIPVPEADGGALPDGGLVAPARPECRDVGDLALCVPPVKG